MGARKREEGVRGLKEQEGWAMADKDKKKLKVILKLPPKSSSSAQPKSVGATALPGGAGGGGGRGAALSAVAGGAANASSKASSVAATGFAFSGLPAAASGVPATGSSHHHQFSSAVGGGLKGHHHHHHQQQQQQKKQKQHRSSGSCSRNLLQSGHLGGQAGPGRHGVPPLPPGSTASAATTSSSGPSLFHTAPSFSSVRSIGNSSAGGASSSSALAASTAAKAERLASFGHLSALPPGSTTHLAPAPTPPKKRKFKTVEHAGGLGIGAVVVGRAGGFATSSASDGHVFVRDPGGAAGGTARVVGGGRGVGRTGSKEGEEEDKTGVISGFPPASSVALPVKKSHKKKVKASTSTDGPPGRNPFAGVIMPEKSPSEPLPSTMLEGVLEKLQKKDTYAVFAEPVDATQVPDYYEIIKEPMDFGTMRKKIKKESYTVLEEFEGDIYLICSNAMRYNGPETIYYKQARSIRDMARKALEGIKTQLAGEAHKPVSHKKKLSPSSKKSHSRKPTISKVRLDGIGSDFASGATLAGDGENSRGWSNSTVDIGKAKKGTSLEKLVGLGEDSHDAWVAQPVAKESKSEMQDEPSGAPLKSMGPKDGRRPLSTEEYHRNAYKQRLLPAHGQGPPLAAIGGENRQLVPVGHQVEHAYAKSLAKFGSGLGPKAWSFIARRLERLNAPTDQPGISNDSVAVDESTVPLQTQTGATTNSHPAVVFGGDLVSSPLHSGQAVHGIPSRTSGKEHGRGEIVGPAPGRPTEVPLLGEVVGSTPSVSPIASTLGEVVSNPSTGASPFTQAVVSTLSQITGTSNVSESVVSSPNHPPGGPQVAQGMLTTSKILPGASHTAKGAISTLNHSSRTSQAAVSSPKFPFGPPQLVQAACSNPVSSVSSHFGQPAVSSLGSFGPSLVGFSEGTPVKGVHGSSQQGEGLSDIQPERGNGRLENAWSDRGSDTLVHTAGNKQILGLDSDVPLDETNARRVGWNSGTGVDQAVSGFALGAASKAFSQAWSAAAPKHGSTSYAYAPMPLSAGRDESNAQAQAWAQARVMSLTNPADSKRNSRDGKMLAFLPQDRELRSDFGTNLPRILQSNDIQDYSSWPRQSTGLSFSPTLASQNHEQQHEAFGNKSGAADKASTPGLSHGNMRPPPLQQSALQHRAMPPDLNVALLSPSALQSPSPQQGSTLTSARHPDLKLQL